MNTLASKIVSAAAFSAIIAVPSTLAQDSEIVELDDFNVTAQYLYTDKVNALETPTPIIDVPQSLSILTAEQITLQGFTSIGDIVNYTPGVNTSQGEGHRDAVVFRGVRSTADFFIDGVRDDVQYYRPLYNLEQVEILRGPNALFFGRGGTGGILNRVTKKGVIGEQFNAYQASINSFGGFDFQIDSNFSTGETSAVRVNAFYESLENHRDYFDGDRIGFNPTARLELGENTILDLSYEYADHQRFIDRGIPTGTDGKPVEAFEDILFADPELNTTELEAHLLRAAVQQSFSDTLKGNLSVFYGDYDKLYQNLYASSYNQEVTPEIVELDGYRDTTQRQSLTLSGNLIGEIETGEVSHTIVGGFDYIDTSSDQDRFNSIWSFNSDDQEQFVIADLGNLSNGVGFNSAGEAVTNVLSQDLISDDHLNDRTFVDLEVISFYLQDEIEISDNFDVIVGLRFDSIDVNVIDDEFPIGDQNRIQQRKDEEISPRLGFVYKPQENISFYASYSESFLPKSGEQYANAGDTSLDPNTFTNIEAGLKWDFAQALSLTAALFEIEQSSPQTDDNNQEAFVTVDSETTGIELQLIGKFTEAWYISAGYTYLDGEQENQAGSTGLRPRELPENGFSLWNKYQVTKKLGLGLGLTYQDESFINNNNTATLPSYTRVDAAAFYDVSEDLRVQLNIENLTDELYFPNSHSTHQATVGESINARFSVIGRF
ncbi:TonB-dependent siderophore receptor [Puniceicoccaceae bacterium K14]|nr:TonB-dependent siderophore receptor [Puniceicoccaceae bacterium K14]